MFQNGLEIDLDEIVSVLERPKRYERYVHAICPFHDDSRPSFFVYPDWYRCLACGEEGSSTRLLAKLSRGKAKYIRKRYVKNPWSKWTENQNLVQILKGSWIYLKKHPSIYLRDRGVPDEIQVKLGLGLRDNWITIPAFDKNKRIIGATARAISEKAKSKYMMPYEVNPNLLYCPDWELINRQDAVFLTFGVIDAISVYICGYAALSTIAGKRIDFLAFGDIRKSIYILPDLGEEKEALVLTSKLGWRGNVFLLNYTTGKDPNDLLVSGELKSELERCKRNSNRTGTRRKNKLKLSTTRTIY